MNKKIYILTVFISSTFLLTLFFAPVVNAQENDGKAHLPSLAGIVLIQDQLTQATVSAQKEPITVPVATNKTNSTNVQEQTTLEIASQSANVNVLENSTNINISTDPAINDDSSLKIESTENASNFINTTDTSIIEPTANETKSASYTEGFTHASSQIHNLEFVTAPVYYSTDCACSREDSPPFPYDNSSPLHTQSALLNISGPTLVPVIGDIVAAVVFPTRTMNVNLLVLALFGNIMMLLLRSYLRLRSGRSPAFISPL